MEPHPAASGTAVTLPEMGESVTEGTVTRWLKAVGDDVALDEPLVEVSTDKVDTEIPSPVAGTLLEITVGEDQTIEVGAQLGIIGDASAAPGCRTGARTGTRAGAGGCTRRPPLRHRRAARTRQPPAGGTAEPRSLRCRQSRPPRSPRAPTSPR